MKPTDEAKRLREEIEGGREIMSNDEIVKMLDEAFKLGQSYWLKAGSKKPDDWARRVRTMERFEEMKKSVRQRK